MKFSWAQQKLRFPVGTEVDGVVVHVTRFGVFADLGHGALGLAELKSLCDKSVDPLATFSQGQVFTFRVIGFRDNDQQIALSRIREVP